MTTHTILLSSLLSILACGDVAPEDKTTNVVAETGCGTDSECGDASICENTECVDGDRNNSPDEAVNMLWEDMVTEYINPAGDVDYFTFTARGGEYVKITTTSDFEDADTVVFLRDPTGQVLTWSDDFPTGSSVSGLDSVVYAYLPDAGEYLISVEDYYAFTDPSQAYGHPNYSYELSVSKWSQVTSEPDSVEDTPLTLDITSSNMWNSVGTLIQADGDHDYIKINYSAKTSEGQDVPFLTVSGIVNLEGSDLQPKVRLLDANYTVLSDRIVGADGSLSYPNMTEGTYYLEILDGRDQGSDRSWTYLFVIAREYSPYPIEIELNNDATSANPIELESLETDGGSQYAVGKYFGTLYSSTDQDWYSIDHTFADGYLIVCLNSTKYGSSAMPIVELWNDALDPISANTCDPDANPNLSIKEQIVETGTYYISVSATEDTQGTLQDWYQFLSFSTSFDPTSFSCP